MTPPKRQLPRQTASPTPAKRYDPLGLDDADQYVRRALQAYQHSGAKAALGLLAEALRLDPSLSEDVVIRKIASEALTLPPESAVHALTQAARHRQHFRLDHGGWRLAKRTRKSRPFLVMVLLGLVLTLLLTTGAFDLYLGSLQTQRWRENLRTDRTPFQLDYYLFVPQTPPPPEGWGMLLLLHGYGANAESVLPSFVEAAAERGLILIAPSLGEYAEPFETMTLPAIDAILNEVRVEYAPHPNGAVLFGYGEGGTLATYYAREYFQVAAVATVAAPQVFPPPEDDPNVVYLFMYGVFDTNRDAAAVSLARFQQSPNRVEVLTIPGADARLTAEQARLTLELAQKLYDPNAIP